MRKFLLIQIIALVASFSAYSYVASFRNFSIDSASTKLKDTINKYKNIEALGEISYIYSGFSREGSSTYEFIMNGTKRSGYDDRNGRFKLGQKFVIFIGDSTKSGSVLKIDHPGFSFKDTIIVSSATIIDVNKWSVSYSYHFGEKLYKGSLIQNDWKNILSIGQNMICLVDFHHPDVSILIPEETLEKDKANFNASIIGDTLLFENWQQRANSSNIAEKMASENTTYSIACLYYFHPTDSLKFESSSPLTKKLFNKHLEHLKMVQNLGIKTIKLNSDKPVFVNENGKGYLVDLNKLSNPYKLLYFNGVNPPRTINIFTETNIYSIIRNLEPNK